MGSLKAIEVKERMRVAQKALRDSLSAEARNAIEERLFRVISELREVLGASTLAIYHAFGSELCLDRFPWKAKLAYPLTLEDGRMEFVLAGPEERENPWMRRPWVANKNVPAGLHVVGEDAIDAFLVPGLAFDEQGGRLGYGGGYYDRYLARPGRRGAAIGIGLAAQQEIPLATHDIRMDVAVVVQVRATGDDACVRTYRPAWR